MEGAIRVEMSANGISMKSNKDNVAKLRWDKLQSSVRLGPDDGFPIYQDAILNGQQSKKIHGKRGANLTKGLYI